jgi:putative ABC transport system substrate-binding protein
VTSHAEWKREVDALRKGLSRLGYEEGKNLIIHYRWAEGSYDRLPGLAAGLVDLKVDAIVTYSTPGARAAKQASSTMPIVVAVMGDPVDAGLVASLHRPGENLTGLTFFFAELCAKRVEWIKEAVPTLTRLAVFVNPANPSHAVALSLMRRTADALAVELVLIDVRQRDDLAAAIARIAAERASALVAIEDPLFLANAEYIGSLALQNKLPLIGFKPYAQAGALLEYGVDHVDLFDRAATLVAKIFEGASPSEIPIERAVKFDLIMNLKTAKALGIELPTGLLLRADEVIE